MKEPKRKELKVYEDSMLKAYENGCEDVKEFIKGIWPEIFPEAKTYRVGDRFVDNDGDTCLLSKWNFMFVLMCIDGPHAGGPCNIPISVKDILKITQDELDSMHGQSRMTLIED